MADEHLTLTKVYRYGLLAPTAGADALDTQLQLAHRYQNALIEIERNRRAAVQAVLGAQSTVADAATRLTTLEQTLDTLRTQIRAARGETRSRKAPPHLQAQAAHLRTALRDARAAIKAARQAERTDPDVQARLATIEADARAAAKAAYHGSGLYWGQRALVDAAMDQARKSPTEPRFRRWTGAGAVGLQIMGGIGVADLATDTRVQIDAESQPVPGRSGKPRPRVRLRVGSTDDRGPVWAEWPVILHRPIPAEARIIWAKAVRRRVCGRDEWSLHLTLQMHTRQAVPDGVVAVDLGWRRQERTRRAGGWSDGTGGADILVPNEVIGELEKVEDLRSIRDTHLNAIRAAVWDWREATDTLPAEHAEALRWLPQWRSPARFAALTRWWLGHRVEGDDAIVAALEAWRTQDRHLWLWETHARRGALARRLDGYRVLAHQLATRYRTLVIERLDLRAMAKIPAPESARDTHPQARSQRHETAPSELRSALVQAFQARGGEIVTVAPSGPAEQLLAAYRERSGVEQMPGTARVSKFGRIRAQLAEREAADARA